MYHDPELSKSALDAHLASRLTGRAVAGAGAAPRLWVRSARPSCGPAVPVVFIVGDVLAGRGALKNAIEDAGWRAEIFASGSAAWVEARDPVPSCLLLDLSSLEACSLLLQRRLGPRQGDMPIICLTAQGDVPMTVRAMKAGAIDVLSKPVQDEALLDAIRDALALSTASLRQGSEARQLQNRYESLTSRERQVMGLVVSGLLNKQVAGKLGISEITVKVHRGQAMRKMQAGTFAQLVRMAGSLQVA